MYLVSCDTVSQSERILGATLELSLIVNLIFYRITKEVLCYQTTWKLHYWCDTLNGY
jgi:hypothetical protein